jgi:hypothetical protein
MALRRRTGGFFVEFQPMSPEEMQRAMQFVIAQQAQFAADSAADHARFEARFQELEAKTDLMTQGIIGLTAIVGRVVDSVSQIADAQTRTDEQLRATDARLSAHISDVESHLNAVIEMFERNVREDHGHRPS